MMLLCEGRVLAHSHKSCTPIADACARVSVVGPLALHQGHQHGWLLCRESGQDQRGNEDEMVAAQIRQELGYSGKFSELNN